MIENSDGRTFSYNEAEMKAFREIREWEEKPGKTRLFYLIKYQI